MPTYSASFGGRAGREGKTPKKKKSKIKCPLCRKNGHEEADCPRAAAGAGEKAGDEAEEQRAKPSQGISHKTSRRAKGSGGGGAAPKLALPAGFAAAGNAAAMPSIEEGGGDDAAYLFFDAGCDVGATLDHLGSVTGGKKSKGDPPSVLYQQGIASSALNYGGSICRQSVYIHPSQLTPHLPPNLYLFTTTRRHLLSNARLPSTGCAKCGCVLTRITVNVFVASSRA